MNAIWQDPQAVDSEETVLALRQLLRQRRLLEETGGSAPPARNRWLNPSVLAPAASAALSDGPVLAAQAIRTPMVAGSAGSARPRGAKRTRARRSGRHQGLITASALLALATVFALFTWQDKLSTISEQAVQQVQHGYQRLQSAVTSQAPAARSGDAQGVVQRADVVDLRLENNRLRDRLQSLESLLEPGSG
ncbi:MAG: hypothetical protein ACI87W_001522 [Halieaceae bacterium]|jgi:hypothetical protein